MVQPDRLADWFEAQRGQLRGLAYRMLGSLSDVDDALQETWLRASAADTGRIHDPGAWLKTILARVCLNMLRSRGSRREESLGTHLPDPIVGPAAANDPEEEALLAESVGLALLVVIQMLTPAERLAFVLHDVFGFTFDEIAPIMGRSTAATRQLASRARRRVKGETSVGDRDLGVQGQVVEAFFAASRRGDLESLLAILDPDVVLRADFGPSPASRVVRGAAGVARYAHAPEGTRVLAALVNGAHGAVVFRYGQPFAVMSFTVRASRIVEIDALADPERLRQLDLRTVLGPGGDAPDGALSIT